MCRIGRLKDEDARLDGQPLRVQDPDPAIQALRWRQELNHTLVSADTDVQFGDANICSWCCSVSCLPFW